MTLIDNSNLDAQAIRLAQLGNFAKLPTELRLMVWESLFRLPHANKYTKPKARTNILSILRCNSYLHNEISYLVYQDMTHRIQIYASESGSWMDVIISSKRLNIVRVLTKDAALRRHIHNFPHDRCRESRLQVDIQHPPKSRLEPGRMIQLWQRINSFVDTINSSPRIPYVCVQLLGKWSNCKSIRDLKSIHHCHYDHDIAIIPFARLPKWSCTITTDLWPTVREKKYSLSHRLFHQLCEPHMEEPDRECIIDEKRKSSNYDSEVHKWFTDIRIYLDVALDTIRGDTAGLLRVERFKNWFEDDDTWKSAYEEQFDFDLRNHWDVVSKYDPFLNKARWRHGMLLIAHHAIHAPMDDKELMNLFYKAPNRKIYTTWDSARWSEAMPHGIDIPQGDMQPELSHWHIYLDYKAWIGKKMISQ